jgi:hypothetical protein
MARKAPPRKARREAAEPRRYRWVDAGATTAYANSCHFESSAEAVFAHFGIDERLTRRVVLPPVLAKRLARLLAQVVQDYEARFGELKLDPR